MVIPPGSSRRWGGRGVVVPCMGAFGVFSHGQRKLEADFGLQLQANEVGLAMLRGVL